MVQDAVIILPGAKCLSLRHLHPIKCWRIASACSAMLDGWSLGHCRDDLLCGLNRIVLSLRAIDSWRFDAITLCNIEHGVIAQQRNALFLLLASLVAFHIQPFPEHDRTSFLALAHVAAQFLRLLEREPERALVTHGVKQEHVDATVGFARKQ